VYVFRRIYDNTSVSIKRHPIKSTTLGIARKISSVDLVIRIFIDFLKNKTKYIHRQVVGDV
jgi:hypothetical protein